jgi:hypothetical protein
MFLELVFSVFAKACVDDADECSHSGYEPGTIMHFSDNVFRVHIDGRSDAVQRSHNFIFAIPKAHPCYGGEGADG